MNLQETLLRSEIATWEKSSWQMTTLMWFGTNIKLGKLTNLSCNQNNTSINKPSKNGKNKPNNSKIKYAAKST